LNPESGGLPLAAWGLLLAAQFICVISSLRQFVAP